MRLGCLCSLSSTQSSPASKCIKEMRFTSVVQFHYVYSLSRGSERTQHKNFTFFFQLNKLTMSSNSTFLSFFACSSPPGFKDHAKSFRSELVKVGSIVFK
ncbi:hypothetical protein IGI04_002162 [Brassica rapa subsp. trilocularis]|uniref:Uncharacterized protein n=1 Tax=Brassica rapa subsp. trilocularis TaxID=1813537 RepID=A0ABQ7NX00_BRACM|nr:hypothetical protein IGI04_002162 [Brassica rapa subsp. trilocularis]